MSIRWITDRLGTAPGAGVAGRSDLCIVDVRDMVDKGGNSAEAVRVKIEQGVAYLATGAVTVVCCDYGISRSNAVAAGILAKHEDISLEAAIRRVQSATGEAEIKLEPLSMVRAALGGAISAPDPHSVVMTGGTGFLGTALQRRLQDDFKVAAPGRAAIDIERGSTAMDILATEASAGVLVHLANPRVYTSNVALGQSLTMLRNVIDVCLSRGITLVYLSGWEVYSGYAGDLHVDETTPVFAKGPYGETKHLAEVMIDHLRRTAGLSCALIRSSPVYGPGSTRPKFIHTFLEKARRGDPITTHRYRNGDPALDLLHIDDLVEAIRRVVAAGYVGDLNIGSGLTTSTQDVARMVIEATGSRSQLGSVAIDADTPRISMNWAKAEKELGWRPSIGLNAGLSSLLSELTKDHP